MPSADATTERKIDHFGGIRKIMSVGPNVERRRDAAVAMRDARMNKAWTEGRHIATEFPKKLGPRLHENVPQQEGGITQPNRSPFDGLSMYFSLWPSFFG